MFIILSTLLKNFILKQLQRQLFYDLSILLRMNKRHRGVKYNLLFMIYTFSNRFTKRWHYFDSATADAVPARVVLYLLSFTGFLVSFMMRTDINIAMVAMVKLPPPKVSNNTSGDSPLICYDLSANSSTEEDDTPYGVSFWTNIY